MGACFCNQRLVCSQLLEQLPNIASIVYGRQEVCPIPRMISTPLYSPTKNIYPPQLQPYQAKMFRTSFLQFFLNLPGPPMFEEGLPAILYFFRDFAVVFSYSPIQSCRRRQFYRLAQKISPNLIYKSFYSHFLLPPLTLQISGVQFRIKSNNFTIPIKEQD